MNDFNQAVEQLAAHIRAKFAGRYTVTCDTFTEGADLYIGGAPDGVKFTAADLYDISTKAADIDPGFVFSSWSENDRPYIGLWFIRPDHR